MTEVERRTLKIILQNVILSAHLREGDVIDVSTGKRVILQETVEKLISQGLAAWKWSDDHEEYRLVLTDSGLSVLRPKEA